MALEILLVTCFLTLVVFWLGDLYLTKETTKRVGSLAEMNPALRAILKLRRKFIWTFKGTEIIIFSYLLFKLSQLDEVKTFSVLLLAILYYILVVSTGIIAYIKAVGYSTPIVALFITISLLMLIFMSMSYKEYQNRVTISNELMDCSSRYSYLYATCPQKEQPQVIGSEFDKYGLNITIPK